MVNSVKIEKLFGRFDYDFAVKDEGVTIITGPNGYGKSTIFKILEAASNKNFLFFIKLSFELIVFRFQDGKSVSLDKSNEESDENYKLRINGTCFNETDYKKMLNQSYRYRRHLEAGEKWEDYYYNVQNDEMHYDVPLENERVFKPEFRKQFELLAELTGEVKIIGDQRLIGREPYNRRRQNDPLFYEQHLFYESILELQRRLKEIIDETLEEYSVQASQLDSDYPNRLLKSQEEITESDYNKKIAKARERFKELERYNLAEFSLIDIEDGSFDKKFATALKIYFDDFDKKYNVFIKLLGKLKLFTSIMNKRLTYKKIEISRKEGFLVKDTENDKNIISLDKLSSGEKHEIVMFFNLIFELNEEQLLLVDEPELSLHVSWQQNFMDDLLEVTKVNKTHVILATHSPQIVGNYFNLQIDLGGLQYASSNRNI